MKAKRIAQALVVLGLASALHGQDSSQDATMKAILQRLDALEKENRELIHEIRGLKAQLQSGDMGERAVANKPANLDAKPKLEERVEVTERRINEQAQTKVEASGKFPLRLTGMLLFNAFANSGSKSVPFNLLSGPENSGATVRQSLLGLSFQGPTILGTGKVSGSIMMDFWSGPSTPGNSWLRLRRADVTVDWARRSFSVGQDKPLISPYQPDSLAQVGVPALAGAGNLWYWLPQARYTERIGLGLADRLIAQVAFLQTDEEPIATGAAAGVAASIAPARPATEGRLAFAHKFNDEARFEVGGGFHFSQTHALGHTIPSQMGTADWLLVAGPRMQVKGAFFSGQNVTNLGGLGNAFGRGTNGSLTPISSVGGWNQIGISLTNRLTWNLFGGTEDDSGAALAQGAVIRDLTYGSNLLYHLGPNVVIGAEALQKRIRTYPGVNRLQNHYDLAIGYLF